MNKFVASLIVIVSLQLLLVGCSNLGETKTGGDTMNTKFEPIRGEEIASAMLTNQHEQLYNQFSNDLKGIVSLEDFVALSKEFTANEESFPLTSSYSINNYQSYVWHSQAKDKGITALLDKDGTIASFQVLHLTSYPETDHMLSAIKYRLPFHDEWFVFWGGQDTFLNYHYEYEHIRYAYDFLKVKDGFTYEGDPLMNESYYAFNQDVVAPADGVVIAVVDGIEDNVPGQMNEENSEGNMVVIEHEQGEYSMLAHFKQHSIVVQVGDTVKSGQLLGKSGNSGYSSEPHIHFQVNKKLDDGGELVIPISFDNGKEWIKGDIARN